MICPKLRDIFNDVRRDALGAGQLEISKDDMMIFLMKSLGNDPAFSSWGPHLKLIANDCLARVDEINKQQHMQLDGNAKGMIKKVVFSLELQSCIAEVLLKKSQITVGSLFLNLLQQNEFVLESLRKIDFPIERLESDDGVITKNYELDVVPKFLVNMNERASAGEYDPLYGREGELKELIEILLRRKKSNPLLLGDAGVGKTAIVEGLADSIASGNVCPALQGAKLFSLSLTNLMAGTRYRGDLEEKLDAMVSILRSIEDSVLFIDELHTVMGTGAGGGGLDTANMLKPYLARGDIRCIAATTKEEFERFIASDKALVRRFSIIDVKPLSEADVVKVLKVIKPKYEKFHQVTYDENILPKIVQSCKELWRHKPLPDAAIDMMDILGARKKNEDNPGDRVRLQDLAQYTSYLTKDA